MPRSFFDTGIRKLTAKWEKCVRLNGDYIEKFDVDSDDNWCNLVEIYILLLVVIFESANFWDAPCTYCLILENASYIIKVINRQMMRIK